MSALLDLHPDGGHPVVAGVAALHRLLDGLDVSEPLAAGDYAGIVADVDRALIRLQAVKLRLLAAADRARVASLSGMADTGAWLAGQTRATGSAAAAEVALAAALEALPATAAALESAEISPAHAAVIAQAMARLPVGLSPEERRTVEESLVELARALDPAALRRRARRAVEIVTTRATADAHEDGLLREDERDARARCRLSLHDNGDGTTSGHFVVPTLAASILRKTVQQLASPRRGHHGSTRAQTGPVGDATDWAHRHGEAFVEILEHLATDHLHGKVAATVVVSLEHRQLTADLAAAHCDTGHDVSASEARRLACNAGVLPAVLDGSSLPLDLGRTQRFFTEHQRVALATQWTTCAASGCDRPFAWCELHHRDPWSAGGTTDLADAIPLCGFHHQRIHDPTYHHQEHPDRSITYHRRT